MEPDEPCAATACGRVLEQMDAVLAREGVARVGAPGEPFDPERHEAIAVQRLRRAPDRTILDVDALGLRARRPRDPAGPGGRSLARLSTRADGRSPPRTTTRRSACRATRATTTSAAPTAPWRAELPPRRQQGARRRGSLQGDLGGLRGPARSGEARRATTASAQLESRARSVSGAGGSAAGPIGGRVSRRAGVDFGGGERLQRLLRRPVRQPRGSRRRAGFQAASRCAAATTRRCWSCPWRRRRPAAGAASRSATAASSRSTIPPGVRDGQTIRLAGQGGPGAGGGGPGDLLLRVRLRPHPRFRVEGGDLYVDLPVAPWEAALGADVPVPTLDGGARVKVPAGLLERPPAAAARSGPARRPGRDGRRPVRGRDDPRARRS